MRQHVNPLSKYFQLPRDLPSPEDLFMQADLPIHLDIGSARGGFLLALAERQPHWNHLGVEIRYPLVLAAEQQKELLGLRNIRFLFCNANVSLENWLSKLPKDQLQRTSIQFPDPWFKRRHRKRRVLQPSLLLALAESLQYGRELFIQSDVLAVIEPMVMLIELSQCFESPAKEAAPWLTTNPLAIATERERYALEQELPVYRMLYRRNRQPCPPLRQLEKSWYQIDNPADAPTDSTDTIKC